VRRALDGGSNRQPAAVLENDGRTVGLIGRTPAMLEVYKMIARVADSSAAVLVTGESGTGKELVARALHTHSSRSASPFVAVNCGALTETLLESELFGHVKGSFTGAISNKRGIFESADQGTVFLDEISETSPALQVKLLRVLQEREVVPVGGTQVIKARARVIAASNSDLEKLSAAGNFRRDLLYRLNVIQLHLPPLRERREDILPLANLFIAEFARNRARLDEATADCLKHYPWPGNVRELRNAIERAVLLSQSELILPDHLPAKLREAVKHPAPALAADTQPLDEMERDAILAALQQHKYNRTETAKALGISRRALLYKLQRLREQGFQFE